MLRRCYLQTDRAMELFFSNNKSSVLAFASTKAREELLSKLRTRISVSSPALPPPMRITKDSQYIMKTSDLTTERSVSASINLFWVTIIII
jgi:hypothetical protein